MAMVVKMLPHSHEIEHFVLNAQPGDTSCKAG
jgi:hypothetical protein